MTTSQLWLLSSAALGTADYPGQGWVSEGQRETERGIWFLELGFKTEFNQSPKDPRSHPPFSVNVGFEGQSGVGSRQGVHG